MKHVLVLGGMLACSGAASPVAPPVPVATCKPAVVRPVVALTAEWPSQPNGADIVARTAAGPFSTLSAVCAALGRDESDDKYQGCHWSEDDELGGGLFVRTGEVSTWEPLEDDSDLPVRLEYFALQTRAGWYVLARLGDTGNRYSSLSVQPERAGGGLLLRYKYDLATAGRFASTVEEGVIACEVVAGKVACTPKIATHTYNASLDTSKPDWPSHSDVTSACTASYTNGVITVTPMPKPDDDDGTWTAEAAAGCSGTRVVRY